MIVRDVTAQKAGKVLVVNADPEIIRILEVNLAHANLEIVSARSGAEALSKIQNDKTDIIILDPVLPDMEGSEAYRRITESSQINYIPVILMSTRSPEEKQIVRAEDIPIYHITKPFDPREVVALVQGYLMHKERMMSINPLTGLPNRTQINKEIDRLIRQGTNFAAIYIVLHDLKAINKVYGYAQGDQVVQLLADIVSESVRLFGNPEDLAGHFSGDKLVVISTPWKARTLCRRIIADFNKRIKALHTDELLQVVFAADDSQPAGKEQAPIMSIHIAVVTNQKRTFRHSLEVTEVASEQLKYLKYSPESNCYYDLKTNGIEPFPTAVRKGLAPAYKEGLKAMQRVLKWVDFLMSELETPMNAIKECIGQPEPMNPGITGEQQSRGNKELHDHYRHLTCVVDGITSLVRFNELKADPLVDEVDIGSVLGWVTEQLRHLAEQREVQIYYEVPGGIGRITKDKKSLTQSLLYIVRSEIHTAPPGSQLHIRVTEESEDNIQIEVNNPGHTISASELKAMFEKPRMASRQKGLLINELYPAQILVRGLGGELEVRSEKGRGVTYQVMIPKKWRSHIQDVSSLQLAMDISRKEAQNILKNARNMLASFQNEVPPAIQEYFERLRSKVQEMGVLGNRALFLVEELSDRLEVQQDRLLQHEVEQGIALEAILTICGEIAKSLRVEDAFDMESAKRVANYALSIAHEFKMSESDRQALRYAAMFKDMALTLSPDKMIEQAEVSAVEEAMAIKTHCDLLWKTLSTIRYLSPALELVQYRYERHDGQGGRFGVKGADIPLGARILAVADTFDLLTSDRSPQGKLAPKIAMQLIAEESGLRFDPRIVSTFLQLWKRKELAIKTT